MIAKSTFRETEFTDYNLIASGPVPTLGRDEGADDDEDEDEDEADKKKSGGDEDEDDEDQEEPLGTALSTTVWKLSRTSV